MVPSIQPQLPNVVAAAAASALFKPGQVLEALVMGKAPDGTVALKIGEMVVNARLPQALPPGTTLQLQVKTGGPAPQLVMVGTPQLPPATVPVQAAPVMPLPPVTVMPAVASAGPAPVAAAVQNGQVPMPSPPVAGPTPPQASTVATAASAPPAAAPTEAASPLPTVAASPLPMVAAPAAPTLPTPTPAASAPTVSRLQASPAALPASPVSASPPVPPALPVQPVLGPAIVESPQMVAAVGSRADSSPTSLPSVALSATGAAPSPGPSPALPPVASVPAAVAPLQAQAPTGSPVPPQVVPQLSVSTPGLVAVEPASLPQVPTAGAQLPQPMAVSPAPGPDPIPPAAVQSLPPTPALAPTAPPVVVTPQLVATNAPVSQPPPSILVTPAMPTATPPVATTAPSAAPQPTAPPQTPPVTAPAVAAPAVPPSVASALSAVVPPPEPAAPSPLLVAQGAARPPPTLADLPKSAPVVAATPQTQPPPLPATPAAALTQMVPEAMARQNSVAPLLASLAAVVARPGALPEPVLRAALQVLGQRVQLPPSGPTAQILEAAIAKSGVYLEASLAKGGPAADLKSGLVSLKGALASWLGGNPAPVTPAQQVAPPLRGMPPRAEPIDPAPLPDVPREVGRALHSQADAALSRVKLMQLASLPDADPVRAAPQELRMEVPFLIGQELVMAQFQVLRDGARQKSESKRGWTMRFAMNFAATGEVGAEVGLLGRSVNVALWAADSDTAAGLEAALPELAPALAALGLEPGTVRVRSLPPETPKPASGHYLDSRR